MNNKRNLLEKIADEIRRCKVCQKWGKGKAVPGEGNPDADIVFIGEAPGTEEAKTGRPFVGRSGRFLRQMMWLTGFKEEEVFITSPIHYMPVRGRPTKESIIHGRVHLLKQLSIINPKIIVLLGSTACHALLDKKVEISRAHGRTINKEDRVYFITFHPAYAMRFPFARKNFEEDFRRLRELIEVIHEIPSSQLKLTMLEPKRKVGLIVVITGHGKGKTTSALGIALRAAGHNMKVCIIHFMKGDMYAGEIDGVKRLYPNVELHLMGKGFCGIYGNPYPFEEHRANAQDALRLAREKMLSGNYDIIILDEINNALKLRLLDLDQVLDLLDKKPPLLHLVLTGRDAHPDVIQRAHTVTEMREIKHAYHQGIEPQKGIDY